MSVFVYFPKEGKETRPLYETSHAAVTLTVFNGESIGDDGYCGCELKCSVLAKRIARAPI